MNYDLFIAMLTAWREARSETLPARLAVIGVIYNRSTDVNHRWKRTLAEVALQPVQFSCYNVGNVNATKFPLPNQGADWLAWTELLSAAMNNGAGDHAHGANHYHDSSIAPPFKMWLGEHATLADLQAKFVMRIGKLMFYKL